MPPTDAAAVVDHRAQLVLLVVYVQCSVQLHWRGILPQADESFQMDDDDVGGLEYIELFSTRFERIKGREFSRKELFKEVNLYLKPFHLEILYNTDAGWRYLIQEVIKDTNKSNYRKLKIRRKVPGGE